MNKKIKIYQLLFSLLLLTSMLGILKLAVADSVGADFSAHPILEKHQTDKKLGYWWLKADANETIKVFVQINNGSHENTFDLSANQAITNQNFVIDYSQPKEKAKSYLSDQPAFDFYQSVLFGDKKSIDKMSINLKANQSVQVPIFIKVPKDWDQKLAIGGINVTRRATASEKKGAMVNVYSSAFALILESKKLPKATDLSISPGKITAKEQNIQLQNKDELLHQKVQLTATIKDSKEKVYASYTSPLGTLVGKSKINLTLDNKTALKNNSIYLLEVNLTD